MKQITKWKKIIKDIKDSRFDSDKELVLDSDGEVSDDDSEVTIEAE